MCLQTSVPGQSGSAGEIGKQFSALQNQVSVLLNVVVATLSAFGIGYYFGAYYFVLGFNEVSCKLVRSFKYFIIAL